MTRWALRPALAALAVCSACGAPQELPAPEVTVSDSAGVRVVRLPPLGSFAVPNWHAERLWSTANFGGSALELFRTVDAVLMGDSVLVLANSGSSELLFLRMDEQSVLRVGREGDGPGEFRRLQHVIRHPSGDILAFDWRFTRFTSAGDLVEVTRLDAENRVVSLRPLAIFEDGTAVAVLGEQRIFQRDGERRDTVPLLAFRPGVVGPDTLGLWMGLERGFAAVPAGSLLVPIGFARTAFAASNGRRVAITSSDSLDVTVFDSELRPIVRVTAAPEQRTVTTSAATAWRQQTLEQLSLESPEVRSALEAARVRDTYPGLDGLVVDPLDRLWVAEDGADEQTRRWVIFSPSGEPLGQLLLPRLPRERLPGRTEILAVGEDRIALLRLNRFDEEIVEVWRISARP